MTYPCFCYLINILGASNLALWAMGVIFKLKSDIHYYFKQSVKQKSFFNSLAFITFALQFRLLFLSCKGNVIGSLYWNNQKFLAGRFCIFQNKLYIHIAINKINNYCKIQKIQKFNSSKWNKNFGILPLDEVSDFKKVVCCVINSYSCLRDHNIHNKRVSF